MILQALMMMVMLTTSSNTYAQRRSVVGQGRRGTVQELAVRSNGSMDVRRNSRYYDSQRGRAVHYNNVRHAAHHHDYIHDGHGRYFRHDGYLPGYVGRVRFLNGRYGYLRDNSWYWYDTYFDPVYYYGRPVHCFHAHLLNPRARKAVAGIAAGVAVGTLIANLVR